MFMVFSFYIEVLHKYFKFNTLNNDLCCIPTFLKFFEKEGLDKIFNFILKKILVI